MTLSQLIAAAQAAYAEHGDVEVLVYDRAGCERPAQLTFLLAKWRQLGMPYESAIVVEGARREITTKEN